MTVEIETLLGEQLGDLAKILLERVAWWGEQIESTPAASVIITTFGRGLTEDEKREALKFYNGDQWPEEIKAFRSEQRSLSGLPTKPARPMLVVNRLPEIAATAIAKDYGAFMPGEIIPAQTAHDIETVKAIIAIHNRDAQMFYNYALSALAELLSNRVLEMRHDA